MVCYVEWKGARMEIIKDCFEHRSVSDRLGLRYAVFLVLVQGSTEIASPILTGYLGRG
jgi:hypothetical protein